jgi:uncharacterized membrane protein
MSNELRNWIGTNVLFATAIYVGVLREIQVVGYFVAALVWVMFAAYAAVLYSRNAKARPYPVPRTVGLLFDAGVLGALVVCGWPLTATGYTLSVLAHEAILWRAARPPAQ